MPVLTEFPARRPEIGALTRVLEEEADRLCAVIENVRSTNCDREQAYMELRRLARNVRVCLEDLGCPPARGPFDYDPMFESAA